MFLFSGSKQHAQGEHETPLRKGAADFVSEKSSALSALSCCYHKSIIYFFAWFKCCFEMMQITKNNFKYYTYLLLKLCKNVFMIICFNLYAIPLVGVNALIMKNFLLTGLLCVPVSGM